MPRITRIEPQQRNKQRVSLFVDDEYFGSLDVLVYAKSGLAAGDEITAEKWEELSVQHEVRTAMDRAMGYLERGARTRREMERYLARKGYAVETVGVVIDRLMEYRYVNDAEVSDMVVRDGAQAGKVGRRVLAAKLAGKGVQREVADAALAAYDTDTEQANANRIAEKLWKRNTDGDIRKKRQKVGHALAAKGFSWDVVREAVRRTDKSAEEDFDSDSMV